MGLEKVILTTSGLLVLGGLTISQAQELDKKTLQSMSKEELIEHIDLQYEIEEELKEELTEEQEAAGELTIQLLNQEDEIKKLEKYKAKKGERAYIDENAKLSLSLEKSEAKLKQSQLTNDSLATEILTQMDSVQYYKELNIMYKFRGDNAFDQAEVVKAKLNATQDSLRDANATLDQLSEEFFDMAKKSDADTVYVEVPVEVTDTIYVEVPVETNDSLPTATQEAITEIPDSTKQYINVLEKELITTSEELENTKNKLQETNATLEELIGVVGVMETESSTLKDSVDYYKNQAETTPTTNTVPADSSSDEVTKQLASELDVTYSKLLASQQKEVQYQKDIADLEFGITGLLQEIEDLKKTALTSPEISQKLLDENTKLHNDVKTAENTIEFIQYALDSVESANRLLQKDYNTLNDYVETLESNGTLDEKTSTMIKDYQEKIQQLQKEKEALASTASGATESNKKYYEKIIEQTENQLQTVRDSVNTLQTQLEQKEGYIAKIEDNHTKELEIKDNALAQQQKANANMKQTIEDLTNNDETASLKADYIKVQELLFAKQDSLNDLRETITAYETVVDELKKENELQDKQITSLEKQAAALNTTQTTTQNTVPENTTTENTTSDNSYMNVFKEEIAKFDNYRNAQEQKSLQLAQTIYKTANSAENDGCDPQVNDLTKTLNKFVSEQNTREDILVQQYIAKLVGNGKQTSAEWKNDVEAFSKFVATYKKEEAEAYTSLAKANDLAKVNADCETCSVKVKDFGSEIINYMTQKRQVATFMSKQ